jgi:metal-dependent amidase/aminoacylase/carboxypeptidase family protein
MNTAFIAECGEGKPILGFTGEYDALTGFSQKIQPTKESVIDGRPGHGCGHNLLGAGAVASASQSRGSEVVNGYVTALFRAWQGPSANPTPSSTPSPYSHRCT